jgi:hypothetical protein
MKAHTYRKQMGAGEKQGTARDQYSAPSAEYSSTRASHKHGLTQRKKNRLVVEETMIGCEYILASDPMVLYRSGVVNTAEVGGRCCKGVDCLQLEMSRVSAWLLNGNYAEVSLQKIGNSWCYKNRWQDIVMLAR